MLQMTNQEKNRVKHIIKTIWDVKLEKYQGVSKWRILDQNSDFHHLSRQSVLASCHLGWCTPAGQGKDCKGDQLTHFPITPLHISYSVFQTIPLPFFQTQLHGEEKDGSRNYLCLKAVQMENLMKMLSCELGLGAPPALHFVILQQHPGWQNPEYSHRPPMTSRERREFQPNHHHFCFERRSHYVAKRDQLSTQPKLASDLVFLLPQLLERWLEVSESSCPSTIPIFNFGSAE